MLRQKRGGERKEVMTANYTRNTLGPMKYLNGLETTLFDMLVRRYAGIDDSATTFLFMGRASSHALLHQL